MCILFYVVFTQEYCWNMLLFAIEYDYFQYYFLKMSIINWDL